MKKLILAVAVVLGLAASSIACDGTAGGRGMSRQTAVPLYVVPVQVQAKPASRPMPDPIIPLATPKPTAFSTRTVTTYKTYSTYSPPPAFYVASARPSAFSVARAEAASKTYSVAPVRKMLVFMGSLGQR